MKGRLSPDRQDEGTWTALPDIGDRAARGTTRNRSSAVATAGITARYGARTFISPAQVALPGVTQTHQEDRNRANRSRSRASRRARAEIISKREGAVADRRRSAVPRPGFAGAMFNPAEFSDANFDVKAWVNSACAGCVIAPSQPLSSAPRFEETRPRTDRSLTFPPSPLPFPTGARAGRAWRNT